MDEYQYETLLSDLDLSDVTVSGQPVTEFFRAEPLPANFTNFTEFNLEPSYAVPASWGEGFGGVGGASELSGLVVDQNGNAINPATGGIVPRATFHNVLGQGKALADEIAAWEEEQQRLGNAGVVGGLPREQTLPRMLADKINAFKTWAEPLLSALGIGGAAAGTPGAAGGRGSLATALLIMLGGAGIAKLMAGGDVKFKVPQAQTSPITAAGNRAVMGALTEPGPGGVATGTGTGGARAEATGMENLQRALQAALAGQKDLAVYYADAAQKEIEMARTALGGMPAYLNPTPETLTAAGDPVSAGLLTRLQNVFGGKVSNPVLEKAIVDMRDQLHNRLMAGRQTGASIGLSSRDLEEEAKQRYVEAALRDADYKQSVASIVPLYNAAAGQGLATRKLFAAPSQGPLSSVASIPVLSGVQSADQAAQAQATREFQAALESVKAQAAAKAGTGKSVTDIANVFALMSYLRG